MNGLLKRITFVLLLGLGSITSIQAVGGYKLTVTKGNVVLIKFNDIQSEVAYVKLIDKDGVQLWSETVTGATTFYKQFNLTQLPDGDYKIIMTDGDVEYTQALKKSINKVYVVSTSAVSFLKPTTTLKNENLKVTFPEGATKLKSVSFQGEKGVAFFTDEVNYKEDFARAYNLNKLARGTYTVILKTDQDTYYKEVELK